MFNFMRKDKSKDERDKKKERRVSNKEKPVKTGSVDVKDSPSDISSKDVTGSKSGDGDRYAVIKHPPPVAPKPKVSQTSSLNVVLRNGSKDVKDVSSPKSILKIRPGSSKLSNRTSKVETQVDDPAFTRQNTILNEQLSGKAVTPEKDVPPTFVGEQRRRESIHSITMNIAPPSVPPPVTPSEKSYSVQLVLPDVAPPKESSAAREIIVKRLPSGDFGFSLRRGVMIDAVSSEERPVVFIEPGRGSGSDILPGDRLVEVNGINVEHKKKEAIVAMIKILGPTLKLQLQSVLNYSELTNGSPENKRIIGQALSTNSQNSVPSSGDASDRMWLVHKGGYSGCQILKGQSQSGAEGHCRVKTDQGAMLDVDEEDLEKCNPAVMDKLDDLASLLFLNETSILHVLRQRYGSSLVHTFSGHSMLLVRPRQPLRILSQAVVDLFKGTRDGDLPPHIYALSQKAYTCMQTSRRDQSILFMGRSGSGKTSSLKRCLEFYALAYGGTQSTSLVNKLSSVFVVLEAFGNCQTALNDNASRFACLATVDFDAVGLVGSYFIQTLMLEKSRVVKRAEGEGSFNVFNYLLNGADSALRYELMVVQLQHGKLFSGASSQAEPAKKAEREWPRLHQALILLGIKQEECRALYQTLAAICNLLSAGVVKGQNNKPYFANPSDAHNAANLLGVTVEDLSKAVFGSGFNANTLRAQTGSRPEPVTDDRITGQDALEGFITGLYLELHSAVISLINRSLSSTTRCKSSISLLDVPGFQNAASGGKTASFDDLCYNYVNERLQMLLHDKTFTEPMDRYTQENIKVDLEDVASSPQPMISLLDKCTAQQLFQGSGSSRSDLSLLDDEDKGILWMLDDAAIMANSSEQQFLERVVSTHGNRAEISLRTVTAEKMLVYSADVPDQFTLNHCQGTAPVTYSVHGWLKQCRENPSSKQAALVLTASNRTELSELFSSTRTGSSGTLGVSPARENTMRRETTTLRRAMGNQAGLKRRSLAVLHKFAVDSLIDTLQKSQLHVMFCMVPCPPAPSKPLDGSLPMMLHVPCVREQLRGFDILLSLRHYRQGFPEYMTFSEFIATYRILAPRGVVSQSATMDIKAAVEEILRAVEMDDSRYRIGLSQIFFRASCLTQLNSQLEEKRSHHALILQKHVRRFLAQKFVQRLKVKSAAVMCIQKNSRIYFRLRNWDWWKLYTKIKPVLNVQRTEEQLKGQQMELEELRSKCDKLEKERASYKTECAKLEDKIDMLQSDYSQERSTLSQAADLLELEVSNRMRLEQELKELQSKYLQSEAGRRSLAKELEETKLWANSISVEDNQDAVDGLTVPRIKYESTVKDLEYKRRKLQQDMEAQMEALQETKHKAERQLQEARAELEEHNAQIKSLKKKVKKLTDEQQDLQRHLEESVAKNAELEKKQRKFDTELQLAAGDMEEGKALKERVQKERDQLLKQKYSLSQQLEEANLEKEALQLKLRRQETEMEEIRSAGSGGDLEVAELRRSKHDLEVTLSAREEEVADLEQEISDLDMTKLKLQLELDRLRNKHKQELEAIEKEMDELREATARKVKASENRIADLEDELHEAMTAKREAERKLMEQRTVAPVRDQDHEKELKAAIRRLKTLLNDTQNQLDRQKENGSQRGNIRALETQLEDAQSNMTAALKAKCSLELELQESQQQINSAVKSKMEMEDRVARLNREKTELENEKEDIEEEMNELMKRYQQAIQQNALTLSTVRDQAEQITQLTDAKAKLQEEVESLSSRVAHLENNFLPKEKIVVLEIKGRELEQKIDYEKSLRVRFENQSIKAKDAVEKSEDEISKLQSRLLEEERRSKNLQLQLSRALEEEESKGRKDIEQSQNLTTLTQKIEYLEAENTHLHSELKTANQRIENLRTELEQAAAVSDYEVDDYDSDSDFAS